MKHAYPPDVLQFVQRSLETGEYASEDDVVVAGMRALREVKRRHQSLRDDIQAALAEIDACAGTQFDPGITRAFREALATGMVER